MKTLNLRYTNNNELLLYLKEHNLTSCENILLQIFTGICESVFINDLITNILAELPQVKIIGSTTDGEILNGEVYTASTILSFSIFDNTEIATYITDNINNESYATAYNLISQFPKTQKPKVAISFADGLQINGENYIKAFSDYDTNLIIAGGLAGDNANFKETIVFTQEGISTNGAVVALLYNDNLIAHTKADFGWTRIGKTLTITKAIDNVVYEINNIKAVDIYSKYLGDDVARELPKTGIEFPLIIKRDDENIARAVIGRNHDDSLLFAGNIEVGDKVTFGYGNIETIISNGEQTYNELLEAPIESIFIYSCMARKSLLGKNVVADLKYLNELSPLSGFFTYGEFFHNSSLKNNELLNQTKTILTLSEKNKISTNTDTKTDEYLHERRKSSHTLKALSHLISQTTKELEEINIGLQEKIQEEVQRNREKDKKIMQQSKLAQMGEMISMIAHQWRQPLSAISSSSSAINLKAKLGTLENQNAIELSEDIVEYTQHLSDTINDFRDFFRPNKEKVETNYTQLITSVLKIVEASIKNQNINIILELECEESFVTYPNEIKQVILNLLKNAEDALVEKHVKAPYIKIQTYTQFDKLILSVSDNGGGIDNEIKNSIFDPYFSTKTKKDGTGLGLYLSKTIIEKHCNGILSVENTEDGAEFKIILEKDFK